MNKCFQKISTGLILASAYLPIVLRADDGAPEEYPYRTYQQFQSSYANSNFKKAFNGVAGYAFQGILVLIALNIILAVGALVVAGAKLGVSNNGASRSEAQTSLLKQAAVFGLIGITPLAFMMIASIMSM